MSRSTHPHKHTQVVYTRARGNPTTAAWSSCAFMLTDTEVHLGYEPYVCMCESMRRHTRTQVQGDHTPGHQTCANERTGAAPNTSRHTHTHTRTGTCAHIGSSVSSSVYVSLSVHREGGAGCAGLFPAIHVSAHPKACQRAGSSHRHPM